MATDLGKTICQSPDSANHTSDANGTPSPFNNTTDKNQYRGAGAAASQAHVESATRGCPFLDKFPPEIRNYIYEILLVNPDLATASSISKDTDCGKKANYGLAPSLLGTCKQINSEAINYLYEKNTFIMAMGHDRSGVNHESSNPSPLTRYGMQGTRPAIVKVRHWKIIMTWDKLLGYSPPEALSRINDHYMERYCLGVQEGLSPLHSLRNLDNLWIGDLASSEIPDIFKADVRTDSLQKNMDGQKALVTELRGLVKGNTPVEFLVEMHHCLVSYVAAFERHEELRAVLKREPAHAYFQDDFDLAPRRNGCTKRGLFKTYEDSISSALNSCRNAAGGSKALEFKESRAFILMHFEDQFQNIVAAAARIVEYMEGLRGAEVYLDIRHYLHPEMQLLADCLVYLEDYNNALRTLPKDTAVEVRITRKQNQKTFYDRFGPLPADLAIEQLNQSINTADFNGCFERCKIAFDDLDSQYLEIVKARKELSKWDTLNETGCAIPVDNHIRDEVVSWELDASVIIPEPPEGEEEEYVDPKSTFSQRDDTDSEDEDYLNTDFDMQDDEVLNWNDAGFWT